MSTARSTGIPVHPRLAFLFRDVKMPFMPRVPSNRETPLTFGEDVAVKMSQRTLVLILVTTATAVLAWANLKSDYRENHAAIQDLVAIRAADSAAQKADHDLLVAAVKGIERLERRADWQDRRDSRNTSAHNP